MRPSDLGIVQDEEVTAESFLLVDLCSDTVAALILGLMSHQERTDAAL